VEWVQDFLLMVVPLTDFWNNMDNFEFILTSYDDCDDFVVEIWYQNNLIAIVKDNDEIQLFDENKNKAIVTSKLFDFAVEVAKKKLNG
jgi:hypothetical protein